MNQPNPSEELQLLVAGYVLNDLSPEESDRLDQLRADWDITALVEDFQQSLKITYDHPEIQPSPRLRAAVMASAEQNMADAVALTTSAARRRSATLESPKKLPWRRRGRSLGAIAALVIAALTTSNVLLWRSLQAQQAQPSAPLVITLQPTDRFDSSAAVVLNANAQTLKATLSISNLPPLEPGKVYVLWTVLAEDAPFTKDPKGAVLTQVFAVNAVAGETQEHTFALPPFFQQPEFVKAIAITIEDEIAPQQHNESPILIHKL